jgi:Na+-transporting NADH:ubiquinone oxidoreductase subunit C
LVGINVSKTNNDPKDLDKDDHEVDAISGATITGDGVTDMIKERLTHYLPYLKQEKRFVALYICVNEKKKKN